MPHFVVDLPGGQGKVVLTHNSVEAIEGDVLVLRDYLGNPCHYPLLPGEGGELGRWLRTE
jgi:L-lysine 2,3-aminomutase